MMFTINYLRIDWFVGLSKSKSVIIVVIALVHYASSAATHALE